VKNMNIPGFTAEASLYRSNRSYRTSGRPDGATAHARVLPQADDTIWTKDTICRACGCSVSGFICDCGANPNWRKIECIKNGGPGKVVSLGGAFTTGGGGVFQGGSVLRRRL
jgi:hypothetical protein